MLDQLDLPALGITRIGDHTGLDIVGLPVWFAARPNSRGLAVSQGKGMTDEQARLSAAMEAVETAYAERCETLVRFVGSLDDLTAQGLAAVPFERLLRTATRLFYEDGINGVGVDRVLAEAGVTRATMYRHFPGKEALVVAYLEHEDETIRGLFEAAAEHAATIDATPRHLLALVIDGVADDATRLHTRGCPFINASAEFPDADGPVRSVVRRHRDWFRATLTELASAAGVDDPAATAASLVLLRDAMLVGSYLDGADVATDFRATARRVAGLG